MHRIRVVHAASLNAEHRQGLQLLYGILVQHFASLAGSASLAGDDVAGDGGRRLPLAHLDALVPHLVELTPQVGDIGGYGGGLWGDALALLVWDAAAATVLPS